MEPVIALRGVVSVLGRFPVLAGVDLDVRRSEVVLVSGPNGAGKTSLLRLCAGLLAPVSGAASVLGCRLPRRGGQLRHRVGYLGHANALYDDLTVSENARFWARAAGVPRAEADAALDRLQVPPRLRHVDAGHLSAGQRRRVALAVLVARRPELWLLDEPHAGLDAAARDELDDLVREAASAGATVLVASHELERAAGLAGRHVVLAGGVVVADDRAPAPAPPRAEGARPVPPAAGRLVPDAPPAASDVA